MFTKVTVSFLAVVTFSVSAGHAASAKQDKKKIEAALRHELRGIEIESVKITNGRPIAIDDVGIERAKEIQLTRNFGPDSNPYTRVDRRNHITIAIVKLPYGLTWEYEVDGNNFQFIKSTRTYDMPYERKTLDLAAPNVRNLHFPSDSSADPDPTHGRGLIWAQADWDDAVAANAYVGFMGDAYKVLFTDPAVTSAEDIIELRSTQDGDPDYGRQYLRATMGKRIEVHTVINPETVELKMPDIGFNSPFINHNTESNERVTEGPHNTSRHFHWPHNPLAAYFAEEGGQPRMKILSRDGRGRLTETTYAMDGSFHVYSTGVKFPNRAVPGTVPARCEGILNATEVAGRRVRATR